MTVEIAQGSCCPDCGSALSTDGDSQGLCPACLMALALDSPTPFSENFDPEKNPQSGTSSNLTIEFSTQSKGP